MPVWGYFRVVRKMGLDPRRKVRPGNLDMRFIWVKMRVRQKRRKLLQRKNEI